MKLIEEIESVCDPEYPLVMIGSRSLDGCIDGYKVSSANSDYDFLVPINKWSEVLSLVDKYVYSDPIEAGPDVKKSNYNNGIKFYIRPMFTKHEINLIPLHLNEYNVWKQAQVALMALVKSDKLFRDSILFKTKRIAVYEQLRSLYKLAVI